MATGSLALPDASPTQRAAGITAALQQVKKITLRDSDFGTLLGLFTHDIKDKPPLSGTLATSISRQSSRSSEGKSIKKKVF